MKVAARVATHDFELSVDSFDGVGGGVGFVYRVGIFEEGQVVFPFLALHALLRGAPEGWASIVWRKTAKKRMAAKLGELRTELRYRMHDPIPSVGRWLRSVVTGCYHYHAVPGNTDRLYVFVQRLRSLWHRTLCRGSQRGRVSWDRMLRLSDRWIPEPRVLHPYPTRRFTANHSR